MVGIEKMNNKQGEEFVKGLEEQPIVSPFEFVETVSENNRNSKIYPFTF